MKKKKKRKGKSARTKTTTLLIRGARVITVDDDNRVADLDIRTEGKRIVEIGHRLKRQRGDQVIDAKGLIAMPGLVQTHVHLCQTLFRAQADDLELLDWLRTRIWPFEGALEAVDLAASARLGIAELLLGGTTTILDMGTVRHGDALFSAAKALGIRYTGGKTIMDQGQGFPVGLRESTEEAIAQSIRLCEKWHGVDEHRLRYAFSPRFVLSCTEEVIRACVREARSRGTLLHTHASENAEEVQLIQARTGMGSIEYLHSLGFTGSNVVLAHCIWMSLAERKIVRDTQTHVVHCPSANLKLASGIAKIAEYLDEGIDVTLGADGAANNNRLDGFEEMRLVALLHKVRSGPTALPAATALRMATRAGALALGLPEVGSLKIGHRADIILLNLHRPHTFPPIGDLISRVVYSARASDVDTVIVDGKILVATGELVAAKLSPIMSAAEKAAQRIAARVA